LRDSFRSIVSVLSTDIFLFSLVVNRVV
jgi:hypothetical protein